MRASASIRPYLLAALIDAEEGLAGAPGARRRRRRRRRPRPRSGPRCLPRAAPGALLPLARHRVRVPSRPAAASGRPADRGARCADRHARGRAPSPRSWSRAPWRWPRPCPTHRCGPRGSSCTAARRSISATSPSSWSRPATSTPTRSRSAASSRCAAASSTSFPRPRSAPRGWSCSATRSSRSAGSRPSPSARSARRNAIELDPAAELALEHRELAEIASEDGERPDIAELLPMESFRAPLELIGDETAILLAAAEEIPAALRDHWEDVTTAMHDADARHLYVNVAEPLAERAIVLRPRRRRAELRTTARPTRTWRAQAPVSAARSISEAESQLERELRSGYRVVVAFAGRGEAERARYNLNRVDARFLEADVPEEAALLFAESTLGEGFVAPDLRLAVIPFRRLVHRRRAGCSPERPGPAGDLRRPARRRLRRPRGPRDRALRRLRDQDPRRRHARLPRARVSRRGQGLRAHRPAREDHPLRRRRRRGAAALRPRLEAVGGRQGTRPQRRPRARRRAAQPLRRAPGAPRPRVRARRGVAAATRAVVPVPRDRRPGGRDRRGQGRHGVRAPDGPADLRRRRLRQDRGRAARRPQGRGRRQAGDDAGADHDPRPAAPGHLPRASGRLPARDRDGLAPAQAGRGPRRARPLRRRAPSTS